MDIANNSNLKITKIIFRAHPNFCPFSVVSSGQFYHGKDDKNFR